MQSPVTLINGRSSAQVICADQDRIKQMSDEEQRADEPGIVYGRRRRDLVEADLVRINLPRALWNARAKGIQDKRVREVVASYCFRIQEMMRTGTGLIVSGSEGVGKSGVAAVIAKEATRWGYSVYIASHEDMQDLRFEDREFADGQTVIARIRSVDLLVLDGFNDDFLEDKKYGPKELDKLVQRRVGARLSMILATRIGMEKFRDEPLRGIRSVMKETCVGIKISGNDLREVASCEMQKRVLENKGANV
jgi:DNA replication protein DnaC